LRLLSVYPLVERNDAGCCDQPGVQVIGVDRFSQIVVGTSLHSSHDVSLRRK